MSLTPAQQQAISARGNVLVVAGAGTGKTRTLVERCLDCLLVEQPPASIDQILMVTFTEAAAAEMRERIRTRLQEEVQRGADAARWQEQLALFETAHFGTLHSFCLKLVRQHFYQLAVDPQLAVMPEEEARLLAEETLDSLLLGHYAGRHASSAAVQRLIQSHGQGWDQPIRSLVLRLHRYSQALPDPAGWLDEQLSPLATSDLLHWRAGWAEAVGDLPGEWQPRLAAWAIGNPVASQCAEALARLAPNAPLEIIAAALRQIAEHRTQCPRGKKKLWLEPLKGFFADVDFLSSLIPAPGGSDPLAEDWDWVREPMSTLLELCREFGRMFGEAKRELGVVDFQDLEQYALQLLWDRSTQQPSVIARQWQERLRFVFVDEYQDINAAQDRIIQALARDGAGANRFLVGDVKQSIYRFRLANPRIFQGYAEQWSQGPARVLPLVDNFRSREGLLALINSVFGLLMTRELGGVDYAPEAALRFGAPAERTALGLGSDASPAAELHLLLDDASAAPATEEEESDEGAAEIFDLQEAHREARLVGMRLRQLQASAFEIWDVQRRCFRPVEWSDMAVLLRSPGRKAECYAKEFARLGVPLHVARGGFYQSLEVSDLLSLLQVLDNPLQDLPVLAVLHSPLVGLSARELAEIRLAAPKVPFWSALIRWRDQQPGATGRVAPVQQSSSSSEPPLEGGSSETSAKVGLFLERFARWRRLSRRSSLSGCLERVLAETHYAAWLLAQPRGDQRRANLQRLLALAQTFDRFQRQGLFRFLRFVDAQKDLETEPEVAAGALDNAVRLMSIHQSKGLEFPVAVLPDLSKAFNKVDLHGEVILDEVHGLCPRVKPPHTGKRYPSLAYWRARRRQLKELLSEELRLLYVAMTRARDRLILCGTVSRSKLKKDWLTSRASSREAAGSARSYADWLALWFGTTAAGELTQQQTGHTRFLHWSVHEPNELIEAAAPAPTAATSSESPIDFRSPAWRELGQRFNWTYPFQTATQIPAKTSVSVLRRQAGAGDSAEAADVMEGITASAAKTRGSGGSASKLSATEIGSAHHQFLQWMSLEKADGAIALAEEARRLEREAKLTPAEVAALDLDALAQFWGSNLGRQIRAGSNQVRRELAFTARFLPSELAGMLILDWRGQLDGEFILVQGVADLVVLGTQELWLLDFKTDQIGPEEVPDRGKVYAPQLKLYCAALSRIYQRPVTQAWLYFLSPGQAVAVSCV